MNITVNNTKLYGSIAAQPSKSHLHRLLICAALSGNGCYVDIPSRSDDITATLRCLTALGAKEDNGFISALKPVKCATLDCGESGTTLRFMLPLAAALGIPCTFICRGRLGARPITELTSQLEINGAHYKNNMLSGKLRPGTYILPGNVSSQYISGLLLALPLLDGISNIVLTSPLTSKPYVDITLDVLKQFGACIEQTQNGFTVYPIGRYTAPQSVYPQGDWSNAAFWLCAGCTVCGLTLQTMQGDAAILSYIQQLGGKIKNDINGISADLTSLKAATLNVQNTPDLVPPLAVLCAIANGTSTVTGAERLRLKESDRLLTVCNMLNSIGITAQQTHDGLIIHGGTIKGGTVDAANDHRIAMAAAICACYSTAPITVLGAECVNKSYPSFWDDFELLHGKTERME